MDCEGIYKILGAFFHHYNHILSCFFIYLLQDDSKLVVGRMKWSLHPVLFPWYSQTCILD